MNFYDNPSFVYSVTAAVGVSVVLLARLLVNFGTRTQAKVEAQILIDDAKESAKELEEREKKRIEETLEQVKRRADRENKRIEENCAKIQEKIEDREKIFQEKMDEKESLFLEHKKIVDAFESKVSEFERRLQQKRDIEKAHADDFARRLEARTEVSRQEFIQELVQRMIDDKKIEMGKYVQTSEHDFQANAEQHAKKVLESVLNRFARPYCPERGIGNIPLETENIKRKVLGVELANLRIIEKLVGVDLVFDEHHQAVNVYGFDPVRRELGRATVEALVKEQNVNEKRIGEVFERVKKELFKKILRDGERIAKELGAETLHPEIKNMMGALRYRYSFTQNQHFHCAEVGFLCGLLAAELDVSVKSARRAGLLHDIGKAMDHSQDGGHAVIGADFIEQHGEVEEIIHAVRAHHFDETPSSDLAYLVIAADALSGARPGARRSTAATYTQKVEGLVTIAQGFQHVTDTHVLSAGREIRVYVDGQAVDDFGALKMSQEIALKIETDMAYPGQIKVTVVRQTQAIEYAR
jgi:ribonucrease Y